MIRITYSTTDRYRSARSFKTLDGARKFAQRWLGETPEMGRFYAVSGDGVGKIECSGCTLYELFPKLLLPLSHAPRAFRSYEQMQGDPGQEDDYDDYLDMLRQQDALDRDAKREMASHCALWEMPF